MVSQDLALDLLLARVLRMGALAGVGLAAGGVLALSALGEPLSPWPLTLGGWWQGGCAGLRALVGLGLWILALTPAAMLACFLVAAARARRWRGVAVALGVLGVCALGLGLAWVGV